MNFAITNEAPHNYTTRIELVFDMMANKKHHQKDKYFTFFHFAEQIKKHSGIYVWKEITDYYLTLREWYERRDVYHKVGYLVAVGFNVRELVNSCKGLSKPNFISYLNNLIQEDLNLTVDKLEELNYHKNYGTIEKLLLLFNVESTLQLKNSSEKYPFNSHKGKQWSLEHIHAQRSDSLNKKEDQQKWLSMHLKSLQNLLDSTDQKLTVQALIEEINGHYENITKVNFDNIASKVFAVLSESDDRSYVDSIFNMASLRLSDNTALNSSTFDVKRNKILDMDKKGEYIPICTRRVFLKYYTESQDHQLQFWGSADRDAYREAMVGEKGMFKKYLKP